MIPWIGLSGRARCGKDTAGEYIAIKYNEHYTQYALADNLKRAASVYFDIPLEWCYDDQKDTRVVKLWGKTVRELLQLFGTESTRNVYGEDFWIKRLDSQIKLAKTNPIITDIRFDNEAQWIVDNGGVIIHIERDSNTIKKSNHNSESGISDCYKHYTIKNDSSVVDYLVKIDKVVADMLA